MSFLPPELWDIIFEKLLDIDASKLEEIRLISGFFNEIVLNNKNLKYKLFLFSYKLEDKPPIEQLLWIVKRDRNFVELPPVLDLEIQFYMWFAKFFEITSINIKENNSILALSCRNNNLPLVKWLAATFGITVEDIISDNNICLRGAAIEGHLTLFKWLVKSFNLTIGDVEADINTAFRGACQTGKLKTCKWILKRFPQIKERIEYSMTYDFCISGSPNMCNWIIEIFPDIRTIERAKYNGLKWACGNGYAEMLRVIMDKFRVIPFNIKDCNALLICCRNGQLHMCKKLIEIFPSLGEYFGENIELYCYYVCKNGHLEMLKWINANYKLPINKHNYSQKKFYVIASKNFHRNICRYLLQVADFNG